jgi:acetyl-CoA carboxylase biotin carboxyl carrier protein
MAKPELDTDLVRALATVLQDTGLTEIEYETGAVKIRVARQVTMTAAVMEAHAPAAVSAASPAASPSQPPSGDHPGAVRSPMVGTVYCAPEPGARPFVQVGETVRQGQTLLIIEAMKVMNPLVAPKAGKVIDVLVTDGQPIEFGEPLIVIE